MDGETFDALVKRLTAARLTRLDALRGFVASAAVGLTGGSLAADETEAKQAKADGKKTKGAGKKKAKGQHAHREAKGKHQGKHAHREAQPKVTLCHKPGTPEEATITVPQSEAK